MPLTSGIPSLPPPPPPPLLAMWPIRPCYFPGCLAAGTKLFGVGVCASLLGVGITNALVAARQVGRWALVGHSDG